MRPIIVFGTICLDRLRTVEKLPEHGGYVEVTSEALSYGGEAANTAFALQKWKTPHILYGNAIGKDADGIELTQLLNAAGIDLSGVMLIDSFPTPVCDIYITPDGDRTMFGRHFQTVRSEQCKEVEYAAGTWFTADPNLGDIAVQKCLEAKRAGMKLLIQDFKAPPELLYACDILLSSFVYFGYNINMEALSTTAFSYANEYNMLTILTDGERGCYLAFPGGEVKHYKAFKAPKVIDSTGCGDIFRAGLLHGFYNGWEIERSIKFASGAAALNCGGLGAAGNVRSVEEIEDFIAAAKLVD